MSSETGLRVVLPGSFLPIGVTYRSVRLLSVGRQESTDDYPEDGMEPTSLLTVEGTAHYLNVTKSWVYDNAEKLPTLRVG